MLNVFFLINNTHFNALYKTRKHGVPEPSINPWYIITDRLFATIRNLQLMDNMKFDASFL